MTGYTDRDEVDMPGRIDEQELSVESIVMDAPTAEAAVEKAAALWNVGSGDIEYEVLEDTKRFFGLLGKKATVRVSTKAPLMHLHARDFANAIMDKAELGLEASLADDLTINLDGDDSAIIIGRHGETLKALEFLTNLIYRSDQSLPKIRIDCGGYRMRREESLVRLAESVAREVVNKKTSISLEPMSSWERRVIHVALQSNRAITTVSEGQEPMRKIVIKPADYQAKRRSPRRRRR